MNESTTLIRHTIRQVYGEVRVDRKKDRVVILLGRYDVTNDKWNQEGVIDLSVNEARELRDNLESALHRIFGES